jgi:hypothetical protein
MANMERAVLGPEGLRYTFSPQLLTADSTGKTALPLLCPK